MTDVATPVSSADDLRRRLVDELVAEGAITTPTVEAAVRAISREAFVPEGSDLAAAYANQVVVTKRDADGRAVSSVSAPWLQARMIEQAALRPGARVLEIGSGGYNAALIAHVVVSTGAVTSIDIDVDVVDRTRSALATTGTRDIHVAHADGEYGYPDNGPYDAIIVTVEASDIPPAWTEQLAPDGTLVVPLRIRGNTRSLALTREGDHLVATSAIVCGFVPMQGAGSQPPQRVRLRGDDIVLRVDDSTDVDIAALAHALDQPRVGNWTPVTTPPGVPFDSLHLWLASQPRPYGLLTADRQQANDLGDPQNWVACPALLGDGSIVYLATRKMNDSTWQFGAHGFGPHADALTRTMNDLVRIWDRDYRHGPGPRITVHPATRALPLTRHPRLVVQRRHTTIAVTWATTKPTP